MRSSCEASATNWRTRCSLWWRELSASSTWSSISLRAAPTCPTSVRVSVSAGSTRSASATLPVDSGIRETRVAVSATRWSGSRLRRTIHVPSTETSTRPRPTPEMAMMTRRPIVASVGVVESPTTSVPGVAVWVARSRNVTLLDIIR